MRLRRLLLGVLLGVLPVLLLAGSATVTAGRVLDPPGLPWVRIVSFSPYATLGYLVALLLLAVTWARGTRRTRTAARALAVVALVGTVLHAAWVAGPYVGGLAPPATPARVHLLSVNLRIGGADTAQVVDIARRQDVGLLVLEEVTPAAVRGLERAGVGRLFRHRAGDTDTGSRGTLVLSRTPLTRVRRLGAPATGSYVMDVSLPGGRVHLVAAHPRAPIESYAGWDADQRLLRRTADGLSGPSMVVGDLNATLDHPELRGLLGDGYVDAASRARVQWQPTWPSSGLVGVLGVPVPPLFAIDHVLLRGGPRAVATRAVAVDRTDHRGLLVTLAP
jgi:endonuclease/exonuclease/phosphatase (EEP) superfamily protein YafD